MNTFQLQCFLAVADYLSFAKAAEQMNVSQPAVTHQIKSLEAELNAKLFHRSTRMVELTPDGQTFLPDARSIVALSEQARLRFADSEERPILPLAIGCSSYNLLNLLQGSIAELEQRHRNLHPRLWVEPRERLFHLLDIEALELVFDIREGDSPRDCVFRPLRSSRLVCACRPDDPLAQLASVGAEELSREKLIFCIPINVSDEVSRLQWRLTEGRSPADIHFCASVEAAEVLAGAGCGVAVVPEILLPRGGGLVGVPLGGAPALDYGLFCKRDAESGLVRQFIQTAKKQLADAV